MRRSGWLIYEPDEAQKNQAYIDRYLQAARRLGIHLQLILSDALGTGIRDGRPWLTYRNQPVDLPHFAIMRAIDPFLSLLLESLAIMVFNSSAISELCLDKRRTYLAACAANLPVMPTSFYRHAADLPEWSAASDLFGSGHSLVLKPVDGRSGRQVMLATNKDEYEKARSVFRSSQSILLQRAASDLGRDLRVYVIGHQIIAAMLRVSDPSRDFRSNYSLGGQAVVYELSPLEKSMILRLVEKHTFGLVGIDFIFEQGQLVFNEVEDVVGARMLYSHTDIDLADRYLSYIVRQLNRRFLPGS